MATTPSMAPPAPKPVTILDAIEEAYKRGLPVPKDKSDIYDEAVKRGLVNDVRVGVMEQAGTDLKSLGEGAKNSTVGLLNMPNAISRYARDKVGGMMGFEPEQLQAMDEAKSVFGIGSPQSSDTVLNKVESATGKYEPRNRRERYLRSMGEAAPSILMGPGGWAARTASALSSGVGSEFGGEQFKGTSWETPARIVGGIVGGSGPDVLRRLISPNPINAARRANIDTLTEAGVPTTAGQRTGNTTLKLMEEELGGGATRRIAEAQDDAFTTAVGREVGMPGPRLGPAEWRQAYDTVDTTFTNLAQRTNLPLDMQLQNDLLDAVTAYRQAGGIANGPEDVMNHIAQLSGQNGGVLSGEAYQNIIRHLRELSDSNPAEVGGIVRNMRTALDGSIERNIAPGLRDAWRQARSQYANLMVVRDAMTKAGPDTAEGIIRPHQLRSSVDQNVSDQRILTGENRLGNLGRAGSNVMATLANSNTAMRQRAQALGATVLSLVGGAGGFGATKDATAAAGGIALGAGLGIAAPLAVGRALMSRPVQAYLSNQMAPERGLTAAQKGVITLMNNNPQIRDYVVKLLEGDSNVP